MGKITVKHYLNTKVLPITNKGIKLYPIYIQITNNRRTTQLRSFTSITASINGFNKLLENEIIENEVSLSTYPKKINELETLRNEIKDIKDSIKYINEIGIDITKKFELREILEILFKDVNYILNDKLYDWIIETEQNKCEMLYEIINWDIPLHKTVISYKKVTKIDLYKIIGEPITTLSKDIYRFQKSTKCRTFLDLLRSPYNEIETTIKIIDLSHLYEYLQYCIKSHFNYYVYGSKVHEESIE